MLKLIAEKIKITEDMIALCNDKVRLSTKEKDSKSINYWLGCANAFSQSLQVLIEMQRYYEDNVQSLEESMRFLRGE